MAKFPEFLGGMRAGFAALPLLAALAALQAAEPAAPAQDARRRQEILFAELPERNAGDAPFDIAAKATSRLLVSLEVISGPAALDGRKLTLSGRPGLVVIRATQDGDAMFLPALAAERAFTVNPAPFAPRILSQPAGSRAAIGDTVVLTVEASGEPRPALQWRKDGIPVAGATGRDLALAPATLSDAGAYDVVAANAAGSATSEQARVTVGKRRQVITFQGPVNATAGTTVALSASATSGLPVRFDVVSGSAVMNGATLTVQSAGTVAVQASQPGDVTFAAAEPVTQTFVVGASGQRVP
jgi:hypothetical protein